MVAQFDRRAYLAGGFHWETGISSSLLCFGPIAGPNISHSQPPFYVGRSSIQGGRASYFQRVVARAEVRPAGLPKDVPQLGRVQQQIDVVAPDVVLDKLHICSIGIDDLLAIGMPDRARDIVGTDISPGQGGEDHRQARHLPDEIRAHTTSTSAVSVSTFSATTDKLGASLTSADSVGLSLGSTGR